MMKTLFVWFGSVVLTFTPVKVEQVVDQVALVQDAAGKDYLLLHDDRRIVKGAVVIGVISDNGTPDDTSDDYLADWFFLEDVQQ